MGSFSSHTHTHARARAHANAHTPMYINNLLTMIMKFFKSRIEYLYLFLTVSFFYRYQLEKI